MLTPTDEQWWAMCDVNMSRPVALREAILTHPFVYDREMGLFYVPFGYHQAAMGTLLAFGMGEVRAYTAAEKLGLRFDSGQLADRWLEGPGRCFRSSVSARVKAGCPGNLSKAELRIFGEVDYLLVR